MSDATDFVRLHITPLDAELVKVVIPASVLPVARNLSYHTLETFPERRYGFVDLPEADAEKLRRKLNGTTLKGCKMRIEKARPERRLEPTGPEDEVLEMKKKLSKDSKDKLKKRKREPDVLEGVVLHDRQVKRGWTEAPTTIKRKNRKDKESKDKDKEKEREKKKKRPKSKYTEGEECLLKTKLPANTIKNLGPQELEQKKRSKKKGSSSRQVVIHEFEKATKFPSFLKTSTATDRKMATEFVEGKGWVDEEGNLVEEVKEKEKAKLPRRPKKAPPPKRAPEESEDDDSTSSSGTSSEGTSSEDEEESEAEPEADTKAKAKAKAKGEAKKAAAKVPSLVVTKAEIKDEKEDDGDTSSDDKSDSDGSDDEEEEDAKQEGPSPKATKQATSTSSSQTNASKSTPGSTKPLAIKIPPPETPSNGKVHPLEALYKRPKPDGNHNNNPTAAPKEAEPFSFFDAADEDLDESAEAAAAAAAAAAPVGLAPMTPFTQKDYEWRNVRSAAPTPDTAHPSRAHRFWGPSPDKDVEMDDDVGNVLQEDYHEDYHEEQEQAEGQEDDEDDEEEASPAQQRQSATTDFQKWFWENRRDLNRSWMTRRKTAAKDKRHRENKARASKAV
ncbi:hypothetical protein J3F83DRAFT_730412 [Trichoderma novae-zelandiae]